MPIFACALPLATVAPLHTQAANESLHRTGLPVNGQGNVRFMRRSPDCYALSGKFADVCAALDALAAQEASQTLRRALH